MKVEFSINKLDTEWWFDLGISFQLKSSYNKRGIFTIAIGIASIYIRW